MPGLDQGALACCGDGIEGAIGCVGADACDVDSRFITTKKTTEKSKSQRRQ